MKKSIKTLLLEKYNLNPKLLIDSTYYGNIDISERNLLSLLEFSQLGIKYVKGSFFCNDNSITSFDYFPKRITGNLWCDNNLIRSFENHPVVDKLFIAKNNCISSNDFYPIDSEKVYLEFNPIHTEKALEF